MRHTNNPKGCRLMNTKSFFRTKQVGFVALLVACALFVGLGGCSSSTNLVEVTLEGGSGRAAISSPTEVRKTSEGDVATIEWSSPHYDYMIVDGKRYTPTNTSGNSTFDIPVLVYDEPFEVIADTTAMSTPHEIEYEITFHTK